MLHKRKSFGRGRNFGFRGRRSQAAMEYVHTYGWILLSVMVIGGVLVYYNVSKVDNILPTECRLLSGMECLDVTVEDDLLKIVVVNGLGFALSNLSISINGTCDSTANTSDINPYGNPQVLLENQQSSFTFECQNISGIEVNEKISLGYVNVETGMAHVKRGRLGYAPGK